MKTRTPEEAVMKAQDSQWFIERFFWLVNKDRKRVPFKYNPAQIKYHKEQTSDDLIIKSRKLGFSTEIEAEFTYDCFTKPNCNAVTMAHTQDDAKVHMDRIQFFINNIGSDNFKFEITLEEESKKELYFPITNSYYWVGTAGATGFGRGRDLTHAQLSEGAHYKDKRVFTSVLEACTKNALKRIETTANGVGDTVHQLAVAAQDPNSGSPWKLHFFAWWMDPENVALMPEGIRFDKDELHMKMIYKLSDEQIYWYRLKKLSMVDQGLMEQEYPSSVKEAFLSSGRHAFNLKNLEIIKARFGDANPEWTGEVYDDGMTVSFQELKEGRLQIWKMPRDHRSYIITADVAKGIPGGAYSVACIADRSSWEVMAQWRSRIDSGAFGKILCDLGRFYNNAILVPENNNSGAATIERIHAEGYKHILSSKELWPDEKNPEDGFPTNERTKSLCVSALRSWIDQLQWAERSLVAIAELESAVFDETGKIVSETGFLDCMITRIILAYCMKFLTVDETYRDKDEDDSPIVTSSLVKTPKGRAGYR